jgi:hypothetical protein
MTAQVVNYSENRKKVKHVSVNFVNQVLLVIVLYRAKENPL